MIPKKTLLIALLSYILTTTTYSCSPLYPLLGFGLGIMFAHYMFPVIVIAKAIFIMTYTKVINVKVFIPIVFANVITSLVGVLCSLFLSTVLWSIIPIAICYPILIKSNLVKIYSKGKYKLYTFKILSIGLLAGILSFSAPMVEHYLNTPFDVVYIYWLLKILSLVCGTYSILLISTAIEESLISTMSKKLSAIPCTQRVDAIFWSNSIGFFIVFLAFSIYVLPARLESNGGVISDSIIKQLF